jgi:ElaB/YqjD/DUF883 family membrane-anchored ribosome-binding protein
MDQDHEPSVEELRQESERSRAALTNTVDKIGQKLSETTEELKERLSPAHLKREAKTYMNDKRVELVGSLEKSARDNPLQALAIGAAIAYPLLGIARHIPIPMMLIGAGIWLSRKRPNVQTTDCEEENAPDPYGSPVDPPGSTDSAKAIKDKLTTAAGQVQDSLTEVGKSAIDAVSSGARAVKETFSASAGDVSKRTAQMSRDSRDSVVSFVENNPLIVAGIGLAVGAFLAAALPASRIENNVLGKGSDRLRGKVRELASDAVEGAKDKTSEIAKDIFSAADQAGLNKQAVGEGIDTLSNKVASVVDRGVNAALGGKTGSGEIRGMNPVFSNGDADADKE